MNDGILGPYSNLTGYESELLCALRKSNVVYFPSSLSSNGTCLGRLEPRTVDSLFSKSPCLDVLNDGYVIPVDMVKEASFFPTSFSVSERRRYLSIPDFIFCKPNDESLEVFPVDIKQGFKLNLGQISAFNLAYLISNSPFIKEILKRIEDIEGKSAEIHPGFFLTSDKINSYNGELVSEVESLKKTFGFEGNLHLKGFPFLDEKVQDIDAEGQYVCTTMKYATMHNDLSFIKNFVAKRGYYPFYVFANRRFEFPGLPREAFSLDPFGKITTSSPELEDLYKQLHQLDEVSPNNQTRNMWETITQMSLRVLDDNYRVANEKLERYVERKNSLFVALSEEMSLSDIKFDTLMDDVNHNLPIRNSGELVDTKVNDTYKKVISAHSKSLDSIQHKFEVEKRLIDKLIGDAKQHLARTRERRQKAHEQSFIKRSRNYCYTPEGFREIFDVWQQTRSDLTKQVESLETKLQDRQERDELLSEKMRSFRKSLPLEIVENSSIANHPSEYYMGFGSDVIKVETFDVQKI